MPVKIPSYITDSGLYRFKRKTASKDRDKNANMILQTFFVMFLSRLSPTVLSTTTSSPIPTISAEISPVNSEVQKEGDTVSLLCWADNFDPDRYALSWYAAHAGIFSSKNAPNSRGEYSFTFERTHPFSTSYILNLTVYRVAQSDSGLFVCNLLIKLSDDRSRGLQNLELTLRVYPLNAFPICNPAGDSSVVVGSQLLCETSGAATPAVNESVSNRWTRFMLHEENRSLLNKTVTSSDNGSFFQCVAVTPGTQMALSCYIGPLTVVLMEGQPTTQLSSVSVSSQTTDGTITSSGLSAADISGIVLGAVILIILIAIHALCCHCDPRKCMNAKSYVLDLSSSIGSWNQRTDSTRRQSEIEVSSSHLEGPDITPAHNSVFDEELGEFHHSNFDESSHSAFQSEQNALYAEPTITVQKSVLNIDQGLSINITSEDVTATSGAAVPTPLAHHKPGVEITNDTPRATVSSSDDSPSNMTILTETVPANPAWKPLPSPQIYPTVDKPKRGVESANSDASSNATTRVIEKPKVQGKPKSIKNFGVNAGQKKDAIPKTVIYADLKLNGAGEGQSINISEELPTVYTEIQHQL